jgi:hypothetical protein
VKEYTVRVRHHIDVEVDVDLCGPHEGDIEHVGDTAARVRP